jgi:hypothetical protein
MKTGSWMVEHFKGFLVLHAYGLSIAYDGRRIPTRISRIPRRTLARDVQGPNFEVSQNWDFMILPCIKEVFMNTLMILSEQCYRLDSAS